MSGLVAGSRLCNSPLSGFVSRLPPEACESGGSSWPPDPFAAVRGRPASAYDLRLPGVQVGEIGGPGVQPVIRNCHGHGFDASIYFTPRLSYCLNHAGCHIVDLDITSRFPKPPANLTVSVRIDPDLSEVWKRTVPAPEPGLDIRIGPVDLTLNAGRLAAMTEARRGSLVVLVHDTDGRELLAATESIEVLAFNEWVAVPGRLDLLAAFVMPNDAAVMEILELARRDLGMLGAPDSLEGYQSQALSNEGHTRPWMIARAVYSALQSGLGISYVNPPASFESTGQKILFPRQILDHRMGTCLDLSVLYAACLERAGLHPLLFIMKGHAFTGFWQNPVTLPTPAEHNWMSVKQAMDDGDLVAVEATAVTTPSAGFDQAVATGRNHVEAGSSTEIVVDVARARMEKIKPMDPAAAQG